MPIVDPIVVYFPNSVAATFPFYGEEQISQGTGAEAPEDFPDSVAADTFDFDAGEVPDP